MSCGPNLPRAQLVEVLPAKEYEWARLPGAVNLPLKELAARTGQLDHQTPGLDISPAPY